MNVIYETETDSQTQRTGLWFPKGVGEGWIENLRLANARSLLYREWISKDLLYSTGNYIQYPVINHNGKEHKKGCVCVYIYMEN